MRSSAQLCPALALPGLSVRVRLVLRARPLADKPLRQKYCRQRLPNNGKYNYRIVRDEYLQMTSVVCEDMHDTNFAFNSLQSSAVYPE